MTDTNTVTVVRDESLIKKTKAKSIAGKIGIYAFLVIYAIIILFPFFVVILTSFKTAADASNPEFSWWPTEGFTIEGYEAALTSPLVPTPLMRAFLNTLMYVIPPTILGLMTSSLAAYAFAKLRFRASKTMYTALLATMMIPGAITISSTYTVFDTIGWVGTPLPLMIPGAFGSAACVFFMRQFFTGIPDSIIEAAKLDGVGFVGIFFTIMVPLSTPALIAQGLLGFIGGYNDYLWPLLYTNVPGMQTLQISLKQFTGMFGSRPNIVMAGTLVALVPTLIIYFFAQDFFIEGIAASGIKG